MLRSPPQLPTAKHRFMALPPGSALLWMNLDPHTTNATEYSILLSAKLRCSLQECNDLREIC